MPRTLRPWTAAEQTTAETMRAAGWSYRAIARAMGRADCVVASKLDAEKRRQQTERGRRLGAQPGYNSWRGMKARCDNPSYENYPRYGGRGITYIKRWQSYEAFISDMGEPPGPGYTLDRVDPDGNYSPDNCRWATAVEQNNNKREQFHRMVTFKGREMPLSVACREAGINYWAAVSRLDRGAPPHIALDPAINRLPLAERRRILAAARITAAADPPPLAA